MPPSIWDLRSSADFDRFPLSPTPPVIRLLYWSMCRAVSVAQLSYLFKYWKSSTTKYKWVCLLLKCNFVTKIRNNLKLLPTASQCGEKLHHFSFIFHLTDFDQLKIRVCISHHELQSTLELITSGGRPSQMDRQISRSDQLCRKGRDDTKSGII